MKSETPTQRQKNWRPRRRLARRSRPGIGGRRWAAWPWRGLAAAALLVVLVCATYAPVVNNRYIWDDDAYIIRNLTLRSPEGLWAIWFSPYTLPQYYPLVHTTFWVEYHLWGLWPYGYHVTNVVLHAIAVVLVWQLFRRLKVPGAWLGAALFAVHPVMVESVAWATERKNVLSLVLVLSSMLAYLRFAPLDTPAQARQSWRARPWGWYALALVLFVLALWSKTVVASMPAVLLVLCWWKRGRIGLEDALPLLPFFLVGRGWGFSPRCWKRTTSGARRRLELFAAGTLVDCRPSRVVLCGQAGLAASGHFFLSALGD